MLLLGLLLAAGFLASSLASYFVSSESLRQSIVATELPLTSDNLYSEIQKDLVRPILISSMMARDTFVRDWAMAGEREPAAIAKYLKEIQERYGAVTSFFISERSRIYYHARGILKTIRQDEPRDVWYFRARALKEPYEINVDIDMANQDSLTIFINYRVFDYDGRFIGITGVGLTVDAATSLIRDYQRRFGRIIFFVDSKGQIVVSEQGQASTGTKPPPGLAAVTETLLTTSSGTVQYKEQGHTHFLNIRYIPELKWFLCVDKSEDEALSDVRNTLYLNLLISFAITGVVLLLVGVAIGRYQKRLEDLATTDVLTGLPNRRAFDLLLNQALQEENREPAGLTLLLIDVDHFKVLNDQHGHLTGDQVLQVVARAIQQSLRQSDIACRWGGEEFIVVVKGQEGSGAEAVAEKLRLAVEAARYLHQNQELGVTISIGVAEHRDGDDGDRLLSRADRALYQAKQAGRNCVRSAVD